jgi:hypothetical protein
MGGHILEGTALMLRDGFKLKTFVETGTFRADTTLWAAGEFKQVFTIEADPGYYEYALEKLAGHDNVVAVFGDSAVQLREVLKQVDEPALLWLDAHWCSRRKFKAHHAKRQCSLLEEIAAVQACGVEHYIMIDDARLFHNPPPPPCDPTAWPTFVQVVQALGSYAITEHMDVIIAVPEAAHAVVVEYTSKGAR